MRCIVLGCTSKNLGRHNQTAGVRFHYVPLRSEKLLTKWLAFCNRKPGAINLTTAHVCSLHFRDSDYKFTRTLEPDAVPSLNAPTKDSKDPIRFVEVAPPHLIYSTPAVPSIDPILFVDVAAPPPPSLNAPTGDPFLCADVATPPPPTCSPPAVPSEPSTSDGSSHPLRPKLMRLHWCAKCRIRFPTASQLTAHRAAKHAIEAPAAVRTTPLISEPQLAAATISASHTEPKRTISTNSLHDCQLCGGIIFNSTLTLCRHRRHVHNRAPTDDGYTAWCPFECFDCHRRFEHLLQLQVHMRTHALPPPPPDYPCPKCPKVLASRSEFNEHTRAHRRRVTEIQRDPNVLNPKAQQRDQRDQIGIQVRIRSPDITETPTNGRGCFVKTRR